MATEEDDLDAELAAWEASLSASTSTFEKIAGWKTSTAPADVEEVQLDMPADDEFAEAKPESIRMARPPSLTTRSRVVLELINTETEYVSAMKALVDDFLTPLKRAYDDKDTQVTSFPDINKLIAMLGPAKAVLGLNQKLLADLNSEGMYGDVGTIFGTFAPFMILYNTYVDGIEDATTVVEKMKEKKQDLYARLTEQLNHKNQQPSDFIIKPLQRIVQYKMIFDNLLKSTSESNEIRPALEDALKKVNAAAEHCDQSISIKRQRQELRDVYKKFAGCLPENINRRLLKQQNLNKTNKRGKQDMKVVFLFSDCLAYKNINSLRVLDRIFMFPDVTAYSEKATLIRVESNKKSFVMQAKHKDRNDWVKSINDAADEFRRRQDLRLKASGVTRKKSFVAPVWSPDTKECNICGVNFALTRRRHHCRRCGLCVCSQCSPYQWFFPTISEKLQRVCCSCYDLLRMEVAGDPDEDISTPKSKQVKIEKKNTRAYTLANKAATQNPPTPPPRGRKMSTQLGKILLKLRKDLTITTKESYGKGVNSSSESNQETKSTEKINSGSANKAAKAIRENETTIDRTVLEDRTSAKEPTYVTTPSTLRAPPKLPTAPKPSIPVILEDDEFSDEIDEQDEADRRLSANKFIVQPQLVNTKPVSKSPQRATETCGSSDTMKPKRKAPTPPVRQVDYTPTLLPLSRTDKYKPTPVPPVRNKKYSPTVAVRRAARKSAERISLTQSQKKAKVLYESIRNRDTSSPF